MKVRIVKRFRDKHTKNVHSPGDVIDIKKNRFMELEGAQGGPYAEAMKPDDSTGGGQMADGKTNDTGDGAAKTDSEDGQEDESGGQNDPGE